MTADPYSALVALAERERAMVADRRFDELEALADERRALVESLPAQAPASARPALERAASLQLATTAALRAALAEAGRALRSMDERHHAVRAYVTSPGRPSSRGREGETVFSTGEGKTVFSTGEGKTVFSTGEGETAFSTGLK